MKKVITLNKDWKFLEHDLAKDCSFHPFYRDDFDDSAWVNVTIPHDNSIRTEFKESNLSGARGGYAKTTMCYYNKYFNVDNADLNKRFELEFEGVYMNSTVYVNGEFVGKYPYGYTTFSYDITSLVKEGKNKISVLVDNEVQPASRWYSGTGIYRPVYLHVTEKLYLKRDDFYVTTPIVGEERSVVEVTANVCNEGKESKHFALKFEIKDKSGKIVAEKEVKKSVSYGGSSSVTVQMDINDVYLWCNANPYLYDCSVTVSVDSEKMDELSQKIGVRDIKFTADNGFIINGKREFLKGVCIHHDNGCLGAAAERDAFIKKIEIVKAMGANAIRTSHNPEAPEFLDLCDEYGMYVMEEAFDEWTLGKRPRIFGNVFIRQPIYAYAVHFNEWAEKDLTAMIKRDRNHPSIVMWSIGNEIEELRHVEGEGLTQFLTNIVKKYDETRPVTMAANGLEAINKTHSPDIVDVCGYNYAEKFYVAHHKQTPTRPIIGSETASITPFEKRGVYDEFIKMTNEVDYDEDENADPEQMAFNGPVLHDTLSRVVRGEMSWKYHKENPFVAGMFIWTGIDYIGEPTPCTWPSVSSYFAPIDRAMLPKDAFYFYKSVWSDETVLHMLPHWSFGKEMEGKTVPVWSFTNCEEVELFVNGKSYGKKRMDETELYHLMWKDVVFEAGELKAVGYRNGEKVEQVIKTAREVSDYKFTADKDSVKVDELVYVDIILLDKDGNFVPNTDTEVEFNCCNNAELIGIDNGSPEFIGFVDNKLETLSGRAIAVFRALNAGEIELTANVKMTDGSVNEKKIKVASVNK